MKIEIRKIPAVLDALGDYYEQRWDWLLRADNGHAIAESPGLYVRRADAIHGAMLTTGLRLPRRIKGQSWREIDMMMPRGAARVYVLYGSGGQVKLAQWSMVRGEFIQLVEAS